MYTRTEFETLRKQWADELAADGAVQREALDLLVNADRHNWIHQTSWFGEPILQLPQDMFVLQEIIFRVRPQYIVEVGVAWAGSLLFYSTLMEALGGEHIVGVDVYIPQDLRDRVASYGKLSKRISLVQGSSLEPATLENVRTLIKNSDSVLVHLDSNHTHDHVLQELHLYSKLVGKGHYLICGDTVVEDIPAQTHRPRPWGPGNNPKTALLQFLKEDQTFEVDRQFQNRYLLTCNPGGYLKKKA